MSRRAPLPADTAVQVDPYGKFGWMSALAPRADGKVKVMYGRDAEWVHPKQLTILDGKTRTVYASTVDLRNEGEFIDVAWNASKDEATKEYERHAHSKWAERDLMSLYEIEVPDFGLHAHRDIEAISEWVTERLRSHMPAKLLSSNAERLHAVDAGLDGERAAPEGSGHGRTNAEEMAAIEGAGMLDAVSLDGAIDRLTRYGTGPTQPEMWPTQLAFHRVMEKNYDAHVTWASAHSPRTIFIDPTESDPDPQGMNLG